MNDSKDKKLDIFISYRNEGGSELAKLVYNYLKGKNYSVFMSDVDLKSGHFDKAIYKRIQEAKDFILICSPGSLDKCKNENDWVRNEIVHAIKCNKNILPILSQGFSIPNKNDLPSDMNTLPDYNGIPFLINMFDQSMGIIIKNLKSTPKKNYKLIISIMITALLISSIIYFLFFNNKPIQNTNYAEETPSVTQTEYRDSIIPINIETNFTPSGWMGDGEDGDKFITYEGQFMDKQDSGNSCIRISYTKGPKKWAGIYWLNTDNNWGTDKGYDLSGKNFTKISFLARSDQKVKKSQFKAGGVKGERYEDSFDYEPKMEVTFNKDWTRYELDLKNKNIQNVIGGFCWIGNEDVTFYLDEIKFE